MKLGWLVWRDEDDETPEFHTTEPPRYYSRVVQIAYAEIVPHE